jgi:hypothetical protein
MAVSRLLASKAFVNFFIFGKHQTRAGPSYVIFLGPVHVRGFAFVCAWVRGTYRKAKPEYRKKFGLTDEMVMPFEVRGARRPPPLSLSFGVLPCTFTVHARARAIESEHHLPPQAPGRCA